MNCNYSFPRIEQSWADARLTHIAIATAIHAIADELRSAQSIWEAPTATEWDHVRMAVQEYVREGLIRAEDDDRYSWGLEVIVLS